MKNRERQRRNRKIKQEMLRLKDSCGIIDPTPYEAIKLILSNNNKKGVKN